MAGLDWSMFDYGDEPWCMVGMQDVPPAVHTALDDEPDVFILPADLDQPIGTLNTRNTVANRLESVNIPGTWVTIGHTFRDVVRFTGAVCQFAQRFQGISGIPADRWFAGGRTLDTTINQLPVRAQDLLIETAESFSFSTAGLSGTSTLRDALKSMGDQYVAAGLSLELEGSL